MSNDLVASILIVDDEPANILLLTKVLNMHGYNDIVHTTDPKEVVVLQNEYKFNLILMDINMPKMNGYEVLKAIQKDESFSNVPVSGDISPQEVKKGLDAGFSDYITKPIKMQDLLKSISELL